MIEAQEFATLPDYLEPGLDLVFVGINPGLYSVAKGHYFARKSSRFWPAFSASKLGHRIRVGLRLNVLTPEQDALLPQFGIGFTDLVKRPSANASQLTIADFEHWIPVFLNKLHRYKPCVACFHGITGFRPFLRMGLKCLHRDPSLGAQPERVGDTWLFVVPNPSPANAHFRLADQIAWYDRLDDFCAQRRSRP
jgi:double-stranded uracil-DNA glycosylase